MHLNDLFLKDVTRSIEGVVKADDVDHLRTEVEEYVLTNDAARGVAPLLEEYTNYSNANGVWISGFFGSGKSHLLKMLAHLLGDVDGQTFSREQVCEQFLQKTDDEMLRASLRRAARIPAKSLLFNIDQKATLISKDQTDALLKVFVKVFNESRGYFGNDGAIARFEEDLDKRGQYVQFKDAFARTAGIDWSQGREQAFLEGHHIDAAFAEVNGAANPGIIDNYQKSYAVSIEDFAESVKSWIDAQEPGYRLNFYVDEVGQFIADDVKLMLNLQTIAESLNTKCRGQAWVFVTSQEDMDKVIGDRTRQQSNDFSKIQARFSTKVKLTSQDVEEVISKRLLQKNERGRERLHELYEQEAANFPTIFDFGEGSKTYRNYADESRFLATYPFVTYQIPLFQGAIEGLSDHNMFEGRNSSVGERSMLGVVQEVAKQIGGEDIGYLAPFDRMFSGISAALKSAAQSAILQAERHLPDPDSHVTKLANRLLKALFLVKYVDSFKATPRNLTVLVYDRFGLDLPRLGDQVREALNLLEAQSYVQRSGNVYEFLTNEEQEIEKEIKGVDIDSPEVSAKLFRHLYSDVLKTSRLRYERNGQDFPFGYKLDDVVHGKQHELTVHFITPESTYTDEEIRAQSTGRDELRVVLQKDKRLLNDLRMLLKTEKYTKQRTSAGTTPSVQAILQAKQLLNSEREKELVERLRKAVGEAVLVINASTVASSSQEPIARVSDGFQELVSRTYNSLSLLGGRVYPEREVASVVKNGPGLVDASTLSMLATPGREMESWILQQRGLGEQVTAKKIVDHFESKPYGWDLGSIEVVLGWLVGNGKVALSVDANQVARTEAPTLIRNTSKHPHLVVTPQKAYDPGKVQKFRQFCLDFFDDATIPSDAAELGSVARARLSARRDELATLVRNSRFPFIAQLTPVIELLDQVAGQTPDWYLGQFEAGDDLLELKEEVIDPILAFVNGQQGRIFDDAHDLLETNAANLQFLTRGAEEPVHALLEDPNVFRGNRIQRLKTAAEALRAELDSVVHAEREVVDAAIMRRREELVGSDYFAAATPQAQARAQEEIDRALTRVSQETQVASLRQLGAGFDQEGYPALLTMLATSPAQPARTLPAVHAPVPPTPVIVAVSTIKPAGANGVLESEADVDRYLTALRSALIAALEDGKRITL